MLEPVGASEAIECVRDLDGEAILRKLMPVRLIEGASRRGARARAVTPRLVASLFSGRRVLLFQHILQDELRVECSALVAEE